jgi:hypothetical protein
VVVVTISRLLLASSLDDRQVAALQQVVAASSPCIGRPEGRAGEPGPMAVVLSGPDAALAKIDTGQVVSLLGVSQPLLDLLSLRCAPPQPEVGSEVVALVIDRVGSLEADVRGAAGLLRESARKWLEANGSEVTRAELAKARADTPLPLEPKEQKAYSTPDQLPCAAEEVRAWWRLLTGRLSGSAFGVRAYRHLPEDLPKKDGIDGFPDPWLQRRLGADVAARSKWTPIDLLGLFVPPPGSYSPNLAAGIHLFLPKIVEFARETGCHPYRMAWFVFLHELTHCHLFCRGSVSWPFELKAIDIEEAFCEAIASLSLRFGEDPFAGVRCPTYPHRWKFSRVRRREPLLYPYSWFPSLLPVVLRLGPERVRDGVLGVGQKLEKTSGDPGRRLLLLEDALEVLEGKASPAVAGAIVRSWRRSAAVRSSERRRFAERDFGVHLWGACA